MPVTQSQAPLAQWPPDRLVTLPANCTVQDAAALKRELLALASVAAPIALDARGAERVDTATVQLLCAFVRDRTANNLAVQWLGHSPAIAEAARLLGVQQMLSLSAAGST